MSLNPVPVAPVMASVPVSAISKIAAIHDLINSIPAEQLAEIQTTGIHAGILLLNLFKQFVVPATPGGFVVHGVEDQLIESAKSVLDGLTPPTPAK